MDPLADYSLMIESRYYKDLPLDWIVVLTDIKNSTEAIDAGRYKEVNTVGMSCIVAVQNALAGSPFPYIFGGDGATLAVPKSEIQNAKMALGHIRAVARREFALSCALR